MHPSRRITVSCLSLLVLAPVARASDIEDFSLEELLDSPVTATTGKALPAREAPGLIVRIEREELLRSGARDLVDVLRFVPSLVPALDVLSSRGLGIRGLWAGEGKVLILVDGLPFTDRLYGSTPSGDRIPAEIIDHVDILRGPGGVVHGRYAQLAVIDVVTIAGRTEAATWASARLGVADAGLDDLGLTAGALQPTRGGSVGTSFWIGAMRPYDGTYVDPDGASADLSAQGVRRGRASLVVREGKLRAQVAAERFLVRTNTGYGWVLPDVLPVAQDQVTADLSADLPVGKATITPRLTAYWQAPWRSDFVPTDDANYYRGDIFFAAPRVDVTVPLSDTIDWTSGAEGSATHAVDDPANPDGYTTFANGEPTITYLTGGAFTQFVGRFGFGTLAGGLRVDAQSNSGLALVPRIAFTRTFGDKAHLKGLVAQAFRPPDVQNFAFAMSELRPELTTTAEIEGGVRLLPATYLTASVFQQRVDRPITYQVAYDPVLGPTEGYSNGDPATTYGADATFRWQQPWVAWNTSVSWYTRPGEPDGSLGLPPLRTYTSAGFELAEDTWITPSLLVSSPVAAVVGFDADGTSIIEKQPATAIVDLCARFTNLTDTGLAVDFGLRNLFDAQPLAIQAYDSGHLPMSTEGRTAFVRFSVAP